jgi:hypothetical protein
MNGGYSNCTNECGCKSCQRQMKRPNGDMTPCRTADKSVSSPEMSSFSSSSSFSSMLSPLSPPSTPLFSPLQQQRVTTNTPTQTHTQRKKPSLRSYEKHLPKPVYSQEDSIYRIEDETYASSIKQQEEVDNNKSSTCSSFSSSTSSSSSRRPDRYEISWKDESGDDMLPSLVTFTTIIEEKGDENPEGLSDFLEQRTRELKDQNYSQKGTNISSVTLSPNPSQLSVFKLPPRTLDCLTLSYRIGSRHHPLTLFDTMKMPNRFDRMDAYGN